MKLSFIKNTNMSSLLVFSLTSLPIISASCSVNNNLYRNNNSPFTKFIKENFNELTINRSSITKKLRSTNDVYFFLQGGHNLSLFAVSKDSLPILNSFSCGGSIYRFRI